MKKNIRLLLAGLILLVASCKNEQEFAGRKYYHFPRNESSTIKNENDRNDIRTSKVKLDRFQHNEVVSKNNTVTEQKPAAHTSAKMPRHNAHNSTNLKTFKGAGEASVFKKEPRKVTPEIQQIGRAHV